MLVNFSWLEEGRVAGMGLPAASGWADLAEHGVGAVLCLTEQPAARSAAALGLTVEHVPLVDFGTPALEDLQRCVRFIERQLSEQRPVVVHCFAGIGRTGTVLASWLVYRGQAAQEALDRVRQLRPGSVETHGQERAVFAFERAQRGAAS